VAEHHPVVQRNPFGFGHLLQRKVPGRGDPRQAFRHAIERRNENDNCCNTVLYADRCRGGVVVLECFGQGAEHDFFIVRQESPPQLVQFDLRGSTILLRLRREPVVVLLGLLQSNRFCGLPCGPREPADALQSFLLVGCPEFVDRRDCQLGRDRA
jgi:hypothetical protein